MGTTIVYSDLEKATDKAAFAEWAISQHRQSRLYRTAKVASRYYAWQNVTISRFVQRLFNANGEAFQDTTASNLRIKSNVFHRLVSQRCMYSLGKGISFAGDSEGGSVKDKLGRRFDDDMVEVGRYALVHAVSFAFWNLDHIDVFKATEFVPVWDEHSGALRAGVYFYRIDPDNPLTAILYEEDGYTVFRSEGGGSSLREVEPKRGYVVTYDEIQASGLVENVQESNYSRLPIVPFWGNDQKTSALEGMRESIDAYDLIKSGFANDVQDCAQIYWIVENAGGMSDLDLAQFRDRLKLTHIANADTDDGGAVKPYTQDVPYAARAAILEKIKADIYEDFGALDVHTVAAGATNDHVDAAYQPLDEEADEFEKHMREGIMDILALQGIEDTPIFSRNRISNVKEQVEIVGIEAQWLDDETILRKLPNVTPDEVREIMDRKEEQAAERMANMPLALQQNALGAGNAPDGDGEGDEGR